MNEILLITIILLVILMIYQNLRKAKTVREDSVYIECYKSILKEEEGAEERLDRYIEEENKPSLKNKARTVRLYQIMNHGNNPGEEIEKIDLKTLFYDDNKVNVTRVSANSDLFVWLVLDMGKARSLSMIDVLEKIGDLFLVYDSDLKNNVEYRVSKAVYEILLEKGNESILFLRDLLAGEYSELSYDKTLIGVFKKIAAAALIYIGEPINEEDEFILRDFAKTQVGFRFMKDLGILERYAEEEKKEEVQ